MSEFRTRRRMSHPFQILAFLAALVMVLGVVFAGIGNAEESDGARARDEASAERDGARAERADRVARSERDETSRDETSRADNRRADNRRADNRRADNRDEPDDTDESPNDLYVPDELADEIVAGTPCTKQAVACVSIGAKKSWLFTKDGTGDTVIDRTVSVSTGGPGKETPVGDFVVEWKHKDHKSSEFFTPHGCTPGTPSCEGAPMNWAVFFAEGGIAFHQGTLNQRSSGCVRLTAADAEFYYTFLQIGDKVEVRA